MTGTLSTAEIRKRSITGTKWVIVMNGMGMPAAFLIALLLGRAGPAVLGGYALVQILIGVITTFVIYGGPPLLSVFMPKIPNAEDRGRLLFSYTLILFAIMISALSLFALFPKGFEFLLQRKFDMANYGWFVFLSIMVVVAETLANVASGLMLIKVTAIARQMMRVVLLPLVSILFIFKREILIAYGMQVIFCGVFVGYLIGAVICVISISSEQRFKMEVGWFLPRGFWAFSLSTMAATVFSFIYENFDRMSVLFIQDVEGLGMYQAVISFTTLVELIPKMLGTTMVPMFSSLLATKKTDATRKAYDVLQRIGFILMIGSALFLISYSSELLSLFGSSYSSYSYILTIFCVAAVVTSPHFGNTPILIAYEKNTFRFTVSMFQILLQVAGTMLFIRSLGIMSIVWAKVICRILANITCTVFVIFRMKLGLTLPHTYMVGIVVAIATAVIRNNLLQAGWGVSTIVFIASLGVYLTLSRVTIHELRNLFLLFVLRKDVE